MSEETILLAEAEHIVKILKTEGFQNIVKWINKRIEICQNKILSNATDMSISNVETKTDAKTKKVNITIVNVEKDSSKSEIRVWKTFLKKIEDWNNLVLDNKRR